MNEKGMEELCNAIILQAVKDYRTAREDRWVANKRPNDVIKDCEKFFLSEWFTLLTRIDGEMLLQQLRRE